MNRTIRQVHYWGTLVVAIPLIVVAVTGILLQVKKQWSWIQPIEQKGQRAFGAVEGSVIDLDTLLERIQACKLARVNSWDDVRRIDIRPSTGVAKITTKDGWEIQADMVDGRVLQEAVRRSDWIESMHDGSFFGGDTVKLGVFLPSGVVMLMMWATGLWLFWLPISVKRRRKLRTAGVKISAIAWVVLQINTIPAIAADMQDDESKKDRRPNIVFILGDDLGIYELGCYGQKKIKTPNIDRLAREGMRFTQHYSGAPVCAPARCVLMTGKHLGHAEIRGNEQAKKKLPQFSEGQIPISSNAVTFAEVLQRNGYATGAFGKWGLGPVGSSGDPNKHGFEQFFGYNCQSIAHSYYPEYLWDNRTKVVINSKPVPGHQKAPKGPVVADKWIGERYAPDVIIEQAEKFISTHKDEPFFLYVPCIEPHVSMHPPLDSLDEFPKEWDTKEYRGGNGYLPHPRPRAAYAAMIQMLDRHVGRVLAALDQHGLTENTIVVFSSDNGPTHPGKEETAFHIGGADPKFFASTGELRGYKGDLYEGGIRVPMIARWPGRIPAGSEHDAASYFADWFPTFCEIANVDWDKEKDRTVRNSLDGVSILPVLEGKVPKGGFERSSPMVWVAPEYTGQIAVRFGDFKLIRRGLTFFWPEEWELYDLAKDPSESNNIIQKHPEKVKLGLKILKEQVAPNAAFPVRFDQSSRYK